MNRRLSPEPANQHEHEFRTDDRSIVEFDGTYVYVTSQCEHEPIQGSYHDDTRDEVYHSTGPRCEAQLTVTYVIGDIDLGGRLTITNEYERKSWEKIVTDNEDEIAETLLTSEAEDTEVVLERDGVEATIPLTVDSTKVLE